MKKWIQYIATTFLGGPDVGGFGSSLVVVKNKKKRDGKRKKKEPRKRLRATEPGCRGFRVFCSLPGAIEHERSSNWAPDAVLHASIREYAKGRGGIATGRSYFSTGRLAQYGGQRGGVEMANELRIRSTGGETDRQLAGVDNRVRKDRQQRIDSEPRNKIKVTIIYCRLSLAGKEHATQNLIARRSHGRLGVNARGGNLLARKRSTQTSTIDEAFIVHWTRHNLYRENIKFQILGWVQLGVV